ncbi:hypothetical protein DPMN_104136 [Dreissena polymorpha]|uniref:Uncharacterized protein n=1 Tax=Dreissena polymorpha TaxID=45954 RepID=A0A9D4HB19_DREPO|nr:hypothetical protein DPMN_104136 [Dreissena polymorpha]
MVYQGDAITGRLLLAVTSGDTVTGQLLPAVCSDDIINGRLLLTVTSGDSVSENLPAVCRGDANRIHVSGGRDDSSLVSILDISLTA